jgi:hypothetical protein
VVIHAACYNEVKVLNCLCFNTSLYGLPKKLCSVLHSYRLEIKKKIKIRAIKVRCGCEWAQTIEDGLVEYCMMESGGAQHSC